MQLCRGQNSGNQGGGGGIGHGGIFVLLLWVARYFCVRVWPGGGKNKVGPKKVQ